MGYDQVSRGGGCTTSSIYYWDILKFTQYRGVLISGGWIRGVTLYQIIAQVPVSIFIYFLYGGNSEYADLTYYNTLKE